MIYIYFKRLFDIAVSGFMLFALSPLFFLLVLVGTVQFGTPFYFDLRAGYRNKAFKVIKFKTMTDARGKGGALLPDEERLTNYGQWLRRLSLDELPQLINVFIGQMSLIGPRPLFEQYLPLYNKEQLRRHHVKPGITGWAQVNGRNQLSWQKKFKLDVWYVDNMNLLLDLKILFLTIKKVIVREGISSASSATMEPFRGNRIE